MRLSLLLLGALSATFLGACAGGGESTARPGQASLDGAAGADAACASGGGCDPAPSDEALGLGEVGAAPAPRRGLGTMTARVPGKEAVVEGVRLASHAVRVTVHDGFARTEVEEVFQNDTAQVLEGRYVFPVPPAASVSRLALWVGERLMEGEMVERRRAAAIFKGIVDDTVRPRDPALLEWVRGGELSLKIFPIPARGSRRVLLAYDEALPGGGAEGRYVYPLSLGPDRANAIDEFSIQVTVTEGDQPAEALAAPGWESAGSGDGAAGRVRFDRQRFAPPGDFVVTWRRSPASGAARAAVGAPPVLRAAAPAAAGARKQDGGAARAAADYFTLRVRADAPSGAPAPPRESKPRVIVVDTSGSQGTDTLLASRRLVAAVLRSLQPGEQFLVLGCDTACEAHAPALEAPTSTSIAGAVRFLEARVAAGASDLAGALVEGARRAHGAAGAQLVYIGDGSPTAGPLAVDAIAARVRPHVDASRLEVRLFGVGRTLDDVVLGGLARQLGGTHRRVATAGTAAAPRAAELAEELARPVLRSPVVELPAGYTDLVPATLPNLVLGEEILLHGRADSPGAGELTLRGELAGRPYVATRPLEAPGAQRNPVVPRLWAEARLAALATSDDAEARRESIRLSRDHHVMSRHTALLVLETDQMYAEFGIERRRGAGPAAEELPGGGGRGEGTASGGGGLGAVGHGSAGIGAALDRLDGDARGSMRSSGGAGVGSGISGLAPGSPAGRQLSGSLGDGGSLGIGDPSARRVASLAIGDVTVSNPSVRNEVRRGLARGRAALRMCYERALRMDPGLQGAVAVRWRIAADGRVAAATLGSGLHPSLDGCVVARVRGMSFPLPADTEPVQVVARLVFTSQEAPPRPFVSHGGWDAAPESTTARHADDGPAWTSAGEDAIGKARAAVDAKPTSRKAHEALVRALLSRGRFEDASQAASRFVELDPDLGVARELAGWAAAARGDRDAALAAVAALVESDPRSARAQVRAARAYEAAGDALRACAHWTALAEVRPDDEALHEALRCRATLEGDAPGALAAARAIARPGPLVRSIVASLEKGEPVAPLADRGNPGELQASVECEGPAGCPLVVVVTPTGAVASPWTPQGARAGARSVAIALPTSGVYRTLIVGGEPGREVKVTVTAAGSTRSRAVTTGGAVSVMATTVSVPATGFGCWGLACLGFGAARLGGGLSP
ncbi:MAG: AgmX/PglI C-terminal domain-containing protein [Polyangiaceae bacterium]|nr:AgmX/PglI C-terminal domain-containing protein [Polyangiaceae bacterium]